jgi:hypothetical protein
VDNDCARIFSLLSSNIKIVVTLYSRPQKRYLGGIYVFGHNRKPGIFNLLFIWLSRSIHVKRLLSLQVSLSRQRLFASSYRFKINGSGKYSGGSLRGNGA